MPPTAETVPAVELADPAFDFMARPCKGNDRLPVGEADLMTVEQCLVPAP
jgi:hypothetical protein